MDEESDGCESQQGANLASVENFGIRKIFKARRASAEAVDTRGGRRGGGLRDGTASPCLTCSHCRGKRGAATTAPSP